MAIAAAVLPGIAFAAHDDDPVRADLFRAVARIVVSVQEDPDIPVWKQVVTGSGFLIDHFGTIATARHVVEFDTEDHKYAGKPRKFDVSLGDITPTYPAQTSECGTGNTDICIITVSEAFVEKSGATSVFAMLCTAPERFDRIVGIGFPPGDFAAPTVAQGSVNGPRAQLLKYPTDLAIVEGMSGGPVLRDGYVIGLNAGGLRANPNITFIQAAIYGWSLFQNAGVSCPNERPAVADLGASGSGNHISPAPIVSPHMLESAHEDVASQDIAMPAGSCQTQTRTFSDEVGPDTRSTIYQISHRVTSEPACAVGVYNIDMDGDAKVAGFNISIENANTELVLNYGILSDEAVSKRVRVSLSFDQVPLAPQTDGTEPVLTDPSNPGPDVGTPPFLDWDSFPDNQGVLASIRDPAMNLDWQLDRKVRTVTVRPDGTIVSGDDAVASNDVEALTGPNLPSTDTLALLDAIRLGKVTLNATEFAPMSLDQPDCGIKDIAVNRTVPPLGGNAQKAQFADRVKPDEGCVFTKVELPEDAGGNLHGYVLPDGNAAIVTYEVESTTDEAGQLSAVVRAVQQQRTPVLVQVTPDVVLPAIKSPNPMGNFGAGFLGF